MKYVFFLFLNLAFISKAQSLPSPIVDGETTQAVALEQVIAQINPGDILILGEYHDQEKHHQNQLQILELLKTKKENVKISVGMEFFEFPQQAFVDDYLNGKLSEDVFLKKINWGQFSFNYYRPLVLFPLQLGGWTYAINAPFSLAKKVARVPIEELSDQEKQLLPPQFTLGNEHYFARFKQAMSGHVPEEKLRKSFISQSLWDDTMAYNAAQIMQNDPSQILVIIVGDFHVQYGGGLPDRLHVRTNHPVKTLSQLSAQGLTDEELQKEINPHPVWGKRADWIWVTE